MVTSMVAPGTIDGSKGVGVKYLCNFFLHEPVPHLQPQDFSPSSVPSHQPSHKTLLNRIHHLPCHRKTTYCPAFWRLDFGRRAPSYRVFVSLITAFRTAPLKV
ncbi:unnamed protein product [Caretta caretta]